MKQQIMFAEHCISRCRGGLIGKVQAYVEANPWQECVQIANALNECPARVSNCLNKLKLEGNAEQIKCAGRSNKSLWAGTSKVGSETRETARAAIELVRDENEQAKAVRAFRTAMRSGNNELAMDARTIGLGGMFTYERMEA